MFDKCGGVSKTFQFLCCFPWMVTQIYAGSSNLSSRLQVTTDANLQPFHKINHPISDPLSLTRLLLNQLQKPQPTVLFSFRQLGYLVLRSLPEQRLQQNSLSINHSERIRWLMDQRLIVHVGWIREFRCKLKRHTCDSLQETGNVLGVHLFTRDGFLGLCRFLLV